MNNIIIKNDINGALRLKTKMHITLARFARLKGCQKCEKVRFLREEIWEIKEVILEGVSYKVV
jgi:hypothetical protein